jgi:hypothetical protein
MAARIANLILIALVAAGGSRLRLGTGAVL